MSEKFFGGNHGELARAIANTANKLNAVPEPESTDTSGVVGPSTTMHPWAYGVIIGSILAWNPTGGIDGGIWVLVDEETYTNRNDEDNYEWVWIGKICYFTKGSDVAFYESEILDTSEETGILTGQIWQKGKLELERLDAELSGPPPTNLSALAERIREAKDTLEALRAEWAKVKKWREH